MPLRPEEIERLRPLTPAGKLLFLAAESRSQWWTSTVEIIDLAGVSRRRGLLELRKLEKGGWLEREERGAQNQERLVRFQPGPAVIKMITAPGSSRSQRSDPHDHTGVIPTITARRDYTSMDAGGRARASGSGSGSKALHRPSIPEGVQGDPGTDGRTGYRASLIRWTKKHWPEVPDHSIWPCLKRIAELGDAREVAAYVKAAAHYAHHEQGNVSVFGGLEWAQFKFGAACTEKRFAPWLEQQRKHKAPAPEIRNARAPEPDAEEGGLSRAPELAALIAKVLPR